MSRGKEETMKRKRACRTTTLRFVVFYETSSRVENLNMFPLWGSFIGPLDLSASKLMVHILFIIYFSFCFLTPFFPKIALHCPYEIYNNDRLNSTAKEEHRCKRNSGVAGKLSLATASWSAASKRRKKGRRKEEEQERGKKKKIMKNM